MDLWKGGLVQFCNTFGHTLLGSWSLIFCSKYDFFFFFPPKRLKAEKLGHKPQNSSDQERVSVACLNKHNLHKIWLLCSKLSSKAIPKGFLLFHIPPRIHTMFRTAYTFSVIVCHEPTLLFWIHVWDNISGADRDQNVRSSGA